MLKAEPNRTSLIGTEMPWCKERVDAVDGTVTVAISLYNYGAFLGECLDSIAAQTHPPLDLVIVDDCSSDTSVEMAIQWLQVHSDRFSRSMIVRHKKNQGLAEARNTAFAYSRTDPVFVMDADNQVYPRVVERLLPYVIDRRYDAAYTQLEFFGDQSTIGFADIWSKRSFRSGNYVDAMALVSRRSWAQVGGYFHIDGGWEDFDFWCKFVDAGMRAIFIPELLCRYRVHGASMLRTETNNQAEKVAAQVRARHQWLAV